MSETHVQAASKEDSRSPSFKGWLWARRFAIIYLALAASFVVHVARFYDAPTGFTRLVLFGDRFAPQRLPKLRDVPVYTYRNSAGYDGQFYAQIAVAGNPFDPALRTALDSPAYRTGRILLPLLAYLVGLGRPASVLTAYALANVVSWLLLAWITARWWFRPTSIDNLVRWTGTMFGAGMLASVTRSLTDGPALLFIAVGVRCLELNRRWLAAGVLGAAGLVREMSILAATAFVPATELTMSAWRRPFLATTLCVLPAALWMGILSAHYGAVSKGGLDTLGIPVTAIAHECASLASTIRSGRWMVVRDEAYVVVAVLAQVAFVLGRPRPALAWWRIAATYAVVALFLSPVAWEDPRWAVTRHLLPLSLAFNVLVPRTRQGLALLLAGNLTVLSASRTLDAGPHEQTTFVFGITCDYASGWHGVEHLGTRMWRWSSGSPVLTLRNPTTGSLRVNIDFDMASPAARTVTLHARDARQVVTLEAQHAARIHFGPLELPPGNTPFALDTTEPPWMEPVALGRPLTFSLQNLLITATSR